MKLKVLRQYVRHCELYGYEMSWEGLRNFSEKRIAG